MTDEMPLRPRSSSAKTVQEGAGLRVPHAALRPHRRRRVPRGPGALTGFIHTDMLYRIRDAAGKPLDDIADMLAEGDVRLNASTFSREFQVHKHIGDYTLFMLGMFPMALARTSGKEFLLGPACHPRRQPLRALPASGAAILSVSPRNTRTRALPKTVRELRQLYRNVLELVRIFLETSRNNDYQRVRKLIIAVVLSRPPDCDFGQLTALSPGSILDISARRASRLSRRCILWQYKRPRS